MDATNQVTKRCIVYVVQLYEYNCLTCLSHEASCLCSCYLTTGRRLSDASDYHDIASVAPCVPARSPDGQQLAVQPFHYKSGTVVVYRTSDWSVICRMAARNVQWSPCGKFLAMVTAYGSEVYAIDGSGTLKLAASGFEHSWDSPLFTPDGTLLIRQRVPPVTGRACTITSRAAPSTMIE